MPYKTKSYAFFFFFGVFLGKLYSFLYHQMHQRKCTFLFVARFFSFYQSNFIFSYLSFNNLCERMNVQTSITVIVISLKPALLNYAGAPKVKEKTISCLYEILIRACTCIIMWVFNQL